MNKRNLMLGLFVLFVVGACSLLPEPSSDVSCDVNGCISLSQFSQNIATSLIGQVEGYVVHVGGVAPVSWGQARTSADTNPIAMSPDVPIQIASVSKTLTAIAVLQLLAKQNLTIDDKISPWLWPNWKQGSGINNITFKDLLRHQSGFLNWQMCNGSQTTYGILENLVSQGITVTLPGPGVYNNCNFAIFREMIPFLWGNSFTPCGGCPPSAYADGSANEYIDYMNQNVFKPVGISTRSCTPQEPNIAKSYPVPAGSTQGDDWQDWRLACGGGGWVLSANDLFAVMNDLATGNALLTNFEKNEMFSNCLGWDCAVRNDCPNPYGSYPYVCKNGGLDNSNFHLRTYIGIFQCNVPVVVIVNSNVPGNDPIPLVENAFKGAKVDGTPVPCLIPIINQARVLPTATQQPRTPISSLPPRLPGAPQATATRPSTSNVRPPILTAPIDGTAVDCGHVNLTWKPAEGSTNIRDYAVELEKLVDRNFVTEKTWNNLRSDSTFFDASCDTHYRWRARDTDNSGKQSDWSRYGYFRVKQAAVPPPAPRTPTPRDTQAPRPPTQVAPVDGATINCGQLALTWRPASDASGIRDYDVQVEKLVDRTFVADKTLSNIRATSTPFDPVCDTHYHWRICATDNAGNQGAWSEFQDFDVQSRIQ